MSIVLPLRSVFHYSVLPFLKFQTKLRINNGDLFFYDFAYANIGTAATCPILLPTIYHRILCHVHDTVYFHTTSIFILQFWRFSLIIISVFFML